MTCVRDQTRALHRYSWENQNGEVMTKYFPSLKKAMMHRELLRIHQGQDVGAIEFIRLRALPPYYQLIEALNDIESLIIESSIVRPARETHQGKKRRRLAVAS